MQLETDFISDDCCTEKRGWNILLGCAGYLECKAASFTSEPNSRQIMGSREFQSLPYAS